VPSCEVLLIFAEHRQALLREAVECIVNGDLATGKAVRRYYVNATVGFHNLEKRTRIPAKSLMRMLGPKGQPLGREPLQHPDRPAKEGRYALRACPEKVNKAQQRLVTLLPKIFRDSRTVWVKIRRSSVFYWTATASRRYDNEVLSSLVILGCSQRKRLTSHLLPAIDRYDGPVFRVLRKHTRDVPEDSIDACVLSGRFGLIPGKFLVPRYDLRIAGGDHATLRLQVEKQLKRTLHKIQPERLFVSVGSQYWPLIQETLTREVPPARIEVATGGIGGRASQLAHWLRSGEGKGDDITSDRAFGEAVLLGTSVRLGRAEVLLEARKALLADPAAARRFETWYVSVGQERVAPKWLVSVLFNKPVASFRTADARRVLSLLGVACVYASGH
jgi:hypothetical protein